MSQGATDASVLMLAGGVTASMIGFTSAVVMYVSQYADPVPSDHHGGVPARARGADVLPRRHPGAGLYRNQLRPVITQGAEVMDVIFAQRREVTAHEA
jgi:hypothetical protein